VSQYLPKLWAHKTAKIFLFPFVAVTFDFYFIFLFEQARVFHIFKYLISPQATDSLRL